MNFLTGLMESSLKQKLLYFLAFGSTLYITRSTYSFFSNILKERNENKEIKHIIEKEKSKSDFNLEQSNVEEKSVYLYYKILNSVYKKETSNFNKKRREIYKLDDIEKYYRFVKEHLRDLKIIEENIFRIIYDELNIDDNGENNLPIKYDLRYIFIKLVMSKTNFILSQIWKFLLT